MRLTMSSPTVVSFLDCSIGFSDSGMMQGVSQRRTHMVSVQDRVKLQDSVKLIRSESERLEQCVNGLPPEALEQPNPCELWDVGDVIGHLIWVAETYGGFMERGLRGDVSVPEGFPTVPGTLSGPAVDELYGQGAIARRRSLGRSLIPTFNERYVQLNDMLTRIGPDDWEKPCYHTHGIRSVRSLLTTIIQELAVHEWDIHSTVEPAPALSVKNLPVLMEKIPSNRRPWSLPFQTGSTSSGPIRFRFELRGVAGGRRDIVVEGDRARVETQGEGSADLTLAGATHTFVLLMYGRLRLGSAIAAGHLKAKGNGELVPDFDRWLERH
jgi:uncharacterized protein (TIGR03083 family)